MTTPVARPRTGTVASVLLLAAAAVGLVDLVIAPLVWMHAGDGINRLGRVLPVAVLSRIDMHTVHTAATAAAGYTAVLGIGMLALTPVAVLVWRRWPPARLIAWIVAGVLVAGQLVAVAVAAGARQVVASATVTPNGLPQDLTDNVRSVLFPGWYLPVSGAVGAVTVALLVAAAVLLARRSSR